MPITFDNLGASANPDINSDTDAASYANTSWTPPTSGLIFLYVMNAKSGGGTLPTISGNGITWTQIATVTFSTGGTFRKTLFGANASGATTGATTIDFAGNTQICCRASFFHADGVDLSGGVAAAFVQSPTASGTATSGSVTLAAAGSADNRPISGFSHSANEATTFRTNWTEADDLAGATPNSANETQHRADAFETTASASWTTSTSWGGIAAEIKASVVAAVLPPKPTVVDFAVRRSYVY